MNTNELTAKYIYEDQERRQMALHVYLAMPTVRQYLIEGIFKAVGEQVKKIDGVEEGHCDETSVYFWNKEADELGVSAWVEKGRGKMQQLVAGVYDVYVDDAKSVSKARRNEIQERFKMKVDLDMWSHGGCISSDPNVIACAYVRDARGGGRWDEDSDFLSRAIQHHDKVVSGVADVLVRIYNGMFPR